MKKQSVTVNSNLYIPYTHTTVFELTPEQQAYLLEFALSTLMRNTAHAMTYRQSEKPRKVDWIEVADAVRHHLFVMPTPPRRRKEGR